MVIDKDEISQFLVVAPMPGLGIDAGVSGQLDGCLVVIVAVLGVNGGIVLYFDGVGVGDHDLGVNYIEECMISQKQ